MAAPKKSPSPKTPVNNAFMARQAKAGATQRTQTVKLSNNPALGEIALLAEKQMRLEDLVESLEAELKDAKRELEEVSTTKLPDALTAVGMGGGFTLTNGGKVEVTPFYSASIKEENRQKAHEWLRKHGFASLIRHDVIVEYAPGDDAKAQKLVQQLIKSKAHFDETEKVHSQTLKAFIREQVESGVKVPLVLFGAFVGRKAKIKRP